MIRFLLSVLAFGTALGVGLGLLSEELGLGVAGAYGALAIASAVMGALIGFFGPMVDDRAHGVDRGDRSPHPEGPST